MKLGYRKVHYIRLTFVLHNYKLQVVKGSLNPHFEETFEFQVPREEFSSRYILFSVQMDNGNQNLL